MVPQIESHFHAGSFAVLYGPPGSFKSFLALDMALCVATGREFLDTYGVQRGKVVYVASEGTYGIARRIQAWLLHQDIAEFPHDMIVIPDAFNLLDPREPAALAQIAAADLGCQDGHLGGGLIVLDTLARNFGPGDENKPADMGGFINHAALLGREMGATVLVVHHTGKDESKEERGHSSLRGACDTMIRMDRQRCEKEAFVTCTKQKDSSEFDGYLVRPRTVDLGDEESSLVLVGQDRLATKYQLMRKPLKVALATLVLDHGTRPFAREEAEASLKTSRRQANRTLASLAAKGFLIDREDSGFAANPAALGAVQELRTLQG